MSGMTGSGGSGGIAGAGGNGGDGGTGAAGPDGSAPDAATDGAAMRADAAEAGEGTVDAGDAAVPLGDGASDASVDVMGDGALDGGAPDVAIGSDGSLADAQADGDAQAQPVPHFWVDWTAATAGAPGTAAGTIMVADGGTIAVTYAGEVLGAQTSGGTNYWIPSGAYTSNDVVENAPPAADIIRLVGGNSVVNTVTFSQPVTNPVMAILSLGTASSAVTYDFDTDFEILSYGQGYWGNGTLSEEAGDVLSGAEGHGVIQFQGTFSTISWTVDTAENWHGFQIGIPQGQ